MKNVIVQCFYKGTPFPRTFSGTTDMWQEWKDVFDKSIVMGLRAGHSLQEQIAFNTEQLNLMEKSLFALGKSAGDGVINKSRWEGGMEKEFIAKCRAGGLNLDDVAEGLCLWFMNVHLLIKTKTIKDDNMNGWILMSGTPDDYKFLS